MSKVFVPGIAGGVIPMRRRTIVVLLLALAQLVALANQASASFPWPLPTLPGLGG